MNINFNFILASKSPRRRILLENLDLNFKTLFPKIEEKTQKDEKNPKILVLNNAILKGESIKSDFFVLSADTIVNLNGKVIGKPKDKDDALNILMALNGKQHEVITAIAISQKGKTIDSKLVKTIVEFNHFSQTVYENYLNIANYKDKAGAYAIQEHGNFLVNKINGSFTNVIGLPIKETLDLLNSVKRY